MMCFLLKISESIKPLLRKASSFEFPTKLVSLSQMAENATTTMSTILTEDTIEVQFKSLQYSLFSSSFVEVLGGVFFLVTAAYILKDKSNVDRAVAGKISCILLIL